MLSGFSQASASTQNSTAAGQRIRVSLDASSSPEVPSLLFFPYTYPPVPFQTVHCLRLAQKSPLGCCETWVCPQVHACTYSLCVLFFLESCITCSAWISFLSCTLVGIWEAGDIFQAGAACHQVQRRCVHVCAVLSTELPPTNCLDCMPVHILARFVCCTALHLLCRCQCPFLQGTHGFRCT